MTIRSLLCLSKPIMCLLEPYQLQSAEHLDLLIGCQYFQEPLYDGHLYKTDTLIYPEGCPS